MAELTVEAEVGGVVVRIECEAGASLGEGDTLIVIESMKMEMPVSSPGGGRVLQILVAVGDAVAEGQAVVVIETP